jgi:hypothetical protein
LIGFSISVAVVAIIGSHQMWYWLLLPFIVFGSAYAASALGLVAGQAAFTLFAVVLFCILLPRQQAGALRLEDIAIGGAVSLIVGLLRRENDDASQGLRKRGQGLSGFNSDCVSVSDGPRRVVRFLGDSSETKERRGNMKVASILVALLAGLSVAMRVEVRAQYLTGSSRSHTYQACLAGLGYRP